MEERVTELEIKVVHLEDYVDVLNDTLIRQQAHIEKLEQRVDRLNERLRATAQGQPEGDPADEKPPHY
jgi:SlyX protein